MVWTINVDPYHQSHCLRNGRITGGYDRNLQHGFLALFIINCKCGRADVFSAATFEFLKYDTHFIYRQVNNPQRGVERRMAHLPGLPAYRYGIRGFGPKGGASAPAIITTTFVVNLRHVLMSSALAVYLRAAHRGLLALYAYGVTDESFAVNLPRFNAGNWSLSRALVVMKKKR